MKKNLMIMCALLLAVFLINCTTTMFVPIENADAVPAFETRMDPVYFDGDINFAWTPLRGMYNGKLDIGGESYIFTREFSQKKNVQPAVYLRDITFNEKIFSFARQTGLIGDRDYLSYNFTSQADRLFSDIKRNARILRKGSTWSHYNSYVLKPGYIDKYGKFTSVVDEYTCMGLVNEGGTTYAVIEGKQLLLNFVLTFNTTQYYSNVYINEGFIRFHYNINTKQVEYIQYKSQSNIFTEGGPRLLGDLIRSPAFEGDEDRIFKDLPKQYLRIKFIDTQKNRYEYGTSYSHDGMKEMYRVTIGAFGNMKKEEIKQMVSLIKLHSKYYLIKTDEPVEYEVFLQKK